MYSVWGCDGLVHRRVSMPDSLAGPPRDRNATDPGDLAAVVLAAGAGERLRPLTDCAPSPCARSAGCRWSISRSPASNAVTGRWRSTSTIGRDQIAAHLAARRASAPLHLSVEEPVALRHGRGARRPARRGSTGGRVLVHNADAWTPADLEPFVVGLGRRGGCASWRRPRRRPVRFGPSVGLVATLLPWAEVVRLEPTPSGLYETTLATGVGRRATRVGARCDGAVRRLRHAGATTSRANLAAAARAGGSIVDPSARVTGTVESSVVGAGAVVEGTVRRLRAVGRCRGRAPTSRSAG